MKDSRDYVISHTQFIFRQNMPACYGRDVFWICKMKFHNTNPVSPLAPTLKRKMVSYINCFGPIINNSRYSFHSVLSTLQHGWLGHCATSQKVGGFRS